MKPVVIIGSGGHGRVILDILEKQAAYEIAGFIDDQKPVGTKIYDYQVLGKVADLKSLEVEHAIIAIGDNWSRGRVARELEAAAPRMKLATAIHPAATLARDVEIQPGTVIMAGAVLNPGTRVGRNCIINTAASVDHDCQIGDFASLGPGAVLGGNVKVGAYSAVSIGATVIHGMQIGANAVIGAGAAVVSDIEAFAVAYGVPCRSVRKRNEDERYL